MAVRELIAKRVDNFETKAVCYCKLTSNELKDKIVELIEHYLSDENVLKDRFLLKHIRRNKEGYISIKLMTQYRKVKSLTKDWKVVANSLRHSKKLELNSEGNRVRRKVPLPEYEEISRYTSVIAYKLPFDKPTVAKVGSLFSPCGDILLIQILRPDNSVPTNVRKLYSKNPELSTEICALIEFEDEKSIKMAMGVKEATVVPLIEIPSRNKKRKNKKKTTNEAPQTSSSSDNDRYSRRSSSVSSGYLSSSPSSSYLELRTTLSTPFRQAAPSVADNRNFREKSSYKLSSILRLPKGPDGTKGFRDLRRVCLSIA